MCLVPNPVLVPFLLIFDLCLLDIPPPLRGAPRYGMTLTAICASFGYASLLQMAFESSTSGARFCR